MAGLPNIGESDPFGPFELPDFQAAMDLEVEQENRNWQAAELLNNDFDVKLPEDYTPPSLDPDPDYVPPTTFEDARARVDQSRKALNDYLAKIEVYAEDTRGLFPDSPEVTSEILGRADVIARGRRDIMHSLEQLTEAEKQLAEAEQASAEDPSFFQKALGVASDALGFAAPLLNFLAGPQEILAGKASVIASMISPEMFGTDVGFGDLMNPVSDIGALFDPDAAIRKRGREMNITVGRSLTAAEEMLMDTPVLGQVYSYGTPFGLMPKVFSGITGIKEDSIRDFRNQLMFEIATDPLNLLEVGTISKTGKLRQLSRVGAGVLDETALRKTLQELPALSRALKSPEEAYKVARAGNLVTKLRESGVGADEAAELAKAFDLERTRNLTNLRQLASNDPGEFSRAAREAMRDAPVPTDKKGRIIHAKRVEYLDKIGEFGKPGQKGFVDPVIGRSLYEQAMIGQRLAALQPIIQRFGHKPWLQNSIRYGSRPWMFLTGNSLKYDIMDKPELLQAYYMQQLRKADMGADFFAHEQMVARHAAAALNGVNEADIARVHEVAIPLIERVEKGKRLIEAGKAFPQDDGLAQAAYQTAKWYEFDAATARAIENRFDFKVAELSGDLGYFGKEFSDELQALIFGNKGAREWLWGEKARRGMDTISTAWLGFEKQRKLKGDFFESEKTLRDGLRAAGLKISDDMPLWKRDGFDVLSRRLQNARKVAERRGMVYGWVEAAGRADPVLLDAARGILDEMGAERIAKAAKNLDKARAAFANADVADMSPEAKAQWVQSTLSANGARVAPGNVSALEVMQKSKVPLPDDLDELARLHVTEFTSKQAEDFQKLHDGMFWKDVTTKGFLDRVATVLLDYPKAVFQGTVLARWASLSKDLIGNAINLAMLGPKVMAEFPQALRDAWRASRDGALSEDVARLRGMGVLRTSRQEAMEGASDVAQILGGQVGITAERVQKMGPVAASIKTLDKGINRAAKAVGIKLKEGKFLAENAAKYRDFKLAARQIFEEAGRIATFRNAIKEGYSELESVEEIYKWWGKFDEMGKVETQILNRTLFFWSWMLRSIPVALRHLVEHPVRSKYVLNLLAGDITNDERMPPWMRRMGGWVLGDDGNGRVRAISTLGSSWFSPLFSAMQGDFANQAMQGKPWEAVQGMARDYLRASPPHVQGAVEFTMEYDLFTSKPWWQNQNAKSGSNAKAPTALWWFHGDNAISDTLGLKATGQADQPKHLSMDPRWNWFFGMMPGVEPGMQDVSAFFRSTKDSEIRPDIDVVKGSARIFGVPIYDVPLETGQRQVREFQNALIKTADSNEALTEAGGRIAPSTQTVAGRQLRASMEREKEYAREQFGMTADQADRYALNQMAKQRPDEFKLLNLQYRLDRWKQHMERVEAGEAELAKDLGSRIDLLNRRAQYDRVAKQELKEALEMYRELGLTPVKTEPEKEKISNADFQMRLSRRSEELDSDFAWRR